MVEGLYPPHSRLFVACDKDVSEEELSASFQAYGTVANVNVGRDRDTGTHKGFAFVQFEKTSQAAAAMEALSGTHIGKSTRPIKVTVALTKDQSGLPGSGDPSQFLRLFLVVPRDMTEKELSDYFSKFGDIDNVTIMRDRETKRSKGYAYVKFRYFTEAAKAFENCDRTYKAMFAKPKEQQNMASSRPKDHGYRPDDSYGACTHIDDNPEGFTSLAGLVSLDLTDEQVEWMFDIPPGLEFVRFFTEPPLLDSCSAYKRKVIAQYDSPGTAAYALRKLNNFEYPVGERVKVQPYYVPVNPYVAPAQASRDTSSTVRELMQQVETLSRGLSDASRLIKSAGLGHRYTAPLGKTAGEIESFRCSAKLPPPCPLAPPNSITQERLFVVCEPGLPPQDALWDVFGRFGNLIELYILNGKNCGYAKYADKGSAHRAMQMLNGQDLYRMRLKVMIAEPKREDRKRPRMTYD